MLVTLEYEVTPEVATLIRLGVAQRLRPPTFAGQPWTPPDPATLGQVKDYVRDHLKSVVKEYQALVAAAAMTPISDPVIGDPTP